METLLMLPVLKKRVDGNLTNTDSFNSGWMETLLMLTVLIVRRWKPY